MPEKNNEEEIVEEEDQIIDLQAKTKTNTTNQGNENTPRSRKVPLENLPDVTTTSK